MFPLLALQPPGLTHLLRIKKYSPDAPYHIPSVKINSHFPFVHMVCSAADSNFPGRLRKVIWSLVARFSACFFAG